MPISPAPPRRSAHSDHSVAAVTPSDTSVSIVEAPCRAALTAERWKGQAPQVTTGSASAVTTHCQPGNCRAGTIESRTTGTVRTADTRSRRRRSACRCSAGEEVSSPAPWLCPASACSSPSWSPSGPPAGASSSTVRRRVTEPLYPARSTAASRSVSSTGSARVTWADSVARLTVALAPGTALSFFSTRLTQAAQVIPSTARSTSPNGAVVLVGDDMGAPDSWWCSVVDVDGGDRVAGLVDGGAQGVLVQDRVGDDRDLGRGALAQDDADLGDVLDVLQLLGHRGHAVRAGHALDLQDGGAVDRRGVGAHGVLLWGG